MKITKRAVLFVFAFCAAITVFCANENSMTSYAYTKANGTIIPASAKVREDAGTDSKPLIGLKQSDKVTIIDEKKDASGTLWYKVDAAGGTVGYIRADLVKKEGDQSTDLVGTENSNSSSEVSASTATSGTVISDSINVRKDADKSAEVVGSIKKGTVVTIIGEKKGTDSKNWYQISLLNNNKEVTGFVRGDLLDTSAAPSKEAEAQPDETQTSIEGESIPEQSTEQVPSENYEEIKNVLPSKIIPEGTDITQVGLDAATLAEWQSGNYYLLYMESTDGSKLWYLYDIATGNIEKKDLDATEQEGEADALSMGTTGKIILIVLAALLLIMIVVCTILFLKLRDANSAWDEEDEEEEEEETEEEEEDVHVKGGKWRPRNFLKDKEDEEEEEEETEEEEEEEDIKPRRRKQKTSTSEKQTSSKHSPVSQSSKQPKSPAKPVGQDKSASKDPAQVAAKPKAYQPDFDEDDEFEFEFLNMNGKDDL